MTFKNRKGPDDTRTSGDLNLETTTCTCHNNDDDTEEYRRRQHLSGLHKECTEQKASGTSTYIIARQRTQAARRMP